MSIFPLVLFWHVQVQHVFSEAVLLLDTGHPFVDDQFIAIGCSEGSRIAHERCRDETIAEQILLPHGISGSENRCSILLMLFHRSTRNTVHGIKCILYI